MHDHPSVGSDDDNEFNVNDGDDLEDDDSNDDVHNSFDDDSIENDDLGEVRDSLSVRASGS